MATYMGPAAADRPRAELLFTDRRGQPLRRTNWRRRVWGPAVVAAGLEPAPTPHDLRHTAAAVAIAQGAHPKAIQARLGHGSIRTTLDLYGGLFPSLDVELVERLEVVRTQARASRHEKATATVISLGREA
jgi:integrase